MRGVSVRDSATRGGRGLFTERDLDHGTLILAEKPKVAVQHAASREEALCCAWCFRFVGSLVDQLARWAGTRRARAFLASSPELLGVNFTAVQEVKCRRGCGLTFCSDECEERAWQAWHQLLCPMAVAEGEERDSVIKLSQLAESTNDKLMMAAMLTAVMALEAERTSAVQVQREWSARPQPLWHTVAVPLGWNPTSPDQSSAVAACRENAKAVSAESLRLLRMAMPRMASQHEWLFSAEAWSRLLGMLHVNCVALQLPSPLQDTFNDAKPQVAAQELLHVIKGVEHARMDGTALYETVCFLNHDCRPNAELELDEAGNVLVRAVGQIDAGTEICISYIDTDRPVDLRTLTLETRYGFRCECQVCTLERSTSDAIDPGCANATRKRPRPHDQAL